MDYGKFIGGILLIVGISIGGSMLALPMVTAAGGFYHSLILMLIAWVIMTFGAFLILEVNLYLPEETNLISMAKATLGKWGQVLTWIVYLLLLYSLLCAYTAGGSDLTNNLLSLINVHVSPKIDSIIFIGILGFIISNGVKVVDLTNRGLMGIKLSAYLLLALMLIPHVNFSRLETGHFKLLVPAIMTVVNSFGFATIIPTLRTYFNSNVKQLRLIVGIGSLIPLICYILWNFTVQGSIGTTGSNGLIHMALSGHSASDLTNALSTQLHSELISTLAHLFISICLTTSFLGVGLCLTDFLADGLHMKKVGAKKWFIMALTFLPPLFIILIHPGLFLLGLTYAGTLCVLLLILLPALMAWSSRYVKKIAHGYQVMGGKWLVAIEIVLAIALLGISFFY